MEQVLKPISFEISYKEIFECMQNSRKEAREGQLAVHSICNIPLCTPFDNLNVRLANNKAEYGLLAFIDLEEGKHNLQLIDYLTQHIKPQICNNHSLLFTTDSGLEYHVESAYLNIEIDGGLKEKYPGDGTKKRVLGGGSIKARKISSLDDFKTDLSEFFRLVELSVNYSARTKSEKGGISKKVEVLSSIYEKDKMSASRIFDLLSIKEETPSYISSQDPVTFEDIGAAKNAKEEFVNICLLFRHPEALKRWGTNSPKGILLHGPPGNGKTLLAKALAYESNAYFIDVPTAGVMSYWYGESEQMLNNVFKEAAARKERSIIYFDEIDAIAGSRAGSTNKTDKRLVSVLLQNMDGMKNLENTLVVGSTNALEEIDDALKRPGRFGKIVYVPLPDKEGREQILRIHARKAEGKSERQIFVGDIDYRFLASQTDGFSGAKIASIIEDITVRRALSEIKDNREYPIIGQIDLQKVIQDLKGAGK